MSTSLSSSAVVGRGQGRGGGEGGREGVRGDKEERWTPLATIARPPPARRPPASASGEAWQASDRTRVTVAAGATLNGPSVGSRARPEPSFTQFNNVPATAQSPRRDRHDELLHSDSHRTAVAKPGDTATAVKASQDTSSSKSNGVSIVKNGTSNGSAGGYGKRKPASQHAQCPCLLEGNLVCKCTLPFSFNSSSSDSTSTPSAVVSSPASVLSGSPSVLRQRKVRFESNISVRTTRENWWDSCGDRGLGLLMSKKMASIDNDAAATGNAEATAAAVVPMEGGNLLPRKNSNESVYVNQSYVGDIAVDDTPEWDHEQFQDTTSRQNVTRVATDEEMLIAATLSRLGITPAGPRLQPPSPTSPSPSGIVIKKSALKSSASPRRGVSFVDQASYQTGTVFKCPVKELTRAAKKNEIHLLEQLKDTKLTQAEYEMAVRQVLRSGKVCYYGPCYRRWVQTLLLASLFLLVWSGGCVAWLSTGVSIRYGAVVCFLIATTVLILGMLVFTLVRKQFDKKSSRLLRNVNEQLSSSGILCSLATDSDGGHLNVLFMAIDVEKCLSTVADDLKRESEPAVCNGASGNCAENNEKTAAQRQELARSIAFGCAASYVSCVSERRLTVRERGGGEYRHLVGTLCLCQYVEKFALNVSGHQDVFS